MLDIRIEINEIGNNAIKEKISKTKRRSYKNTNKIVHLAKENQNK